MSVKQTVPPSICELEFNQREQGDWIALATESYWDWKNGVCWRSLLDIGFKPWKNEQTRLASGEPLPDNVSETDRRDA